MNFENKNLCGSREEIVDLISKAQSGSDDAFRVLQNKYTPLIESQVRKHLADYMSNQDMADLREEAIIAFYSAVCNYDCSEENVEFGLYAKICIGNGLVTFIRAYNKRSRCGVVPLDDVSDMVVRDDDDTDPSKQIIDKENAQALIRKIQSNLSPYEAQVWWLYTSGLSAKDIARRVQRDDARSVENAIYRIRKKLRKLLGD